MRPPLPSLVSKNTAIVLMGVLRDCLAVSDQEWPGTKAWRSGRRQAVCRKPDQSTAEPAGSWIRRKQACLKWSLGLVFWAPDNQPHMQHLKPLYLKPDLTRTTSKMEGLLPPEAYWCFHILKNSQQLSNPLWITKKSQIPLPYGKTSDFFKNTCGGS